MLFGSLVAIVTPMFEDGSLDYESFGKLIDWHIDSGTRGIVVVGTTGESPTVTVDEHAALIDLVAAEQAPQRVNLAGSVTAKQVRVSQRGNRFAFIQFTDQTGVFEVTFFSDVLAEANDLLASGKPLLISANLKVEDNGPRLLAARVQLLDDAIAAWHGGVALWVQDEKPLKSLKEALKSDGPGKAEVKIQLIVKGQEVCIGLPGRFKLSGDLRQELRRMPGILNVREL